MTRSDQCSYTVLL